MLGLSEYIGLFVLVVTMGIGVPAAGDAALIAAGTLAGEGRLNVWIVLVTSMAAWMLGSLAAYKIGSLQGRRLLERPGWLEKTRRSLLTRGDREFGRHVFLASVALPSYMSGIFRVRIRLFLLVALLVGIGWVGAYVGISYFLGAEIAKRVGSNGARALLGVLLVVAIGLAIKAGLSRWRSTRGVGSSGRPAGKDGRKEKCP